MSRHESGRKSVSGVTEQMLTILRLDPDAHLELSPWTGMWFVQSVLHISDGDIMRGITEHRDTPEEAVDGFLDRLWSHGVDEYITNAKTGDKRRNWRLAGVLFREVLTEQLKLERKQV